MGSTRNKLSPEEDEEWLVRDIGPSLRGLPIEGYRKTTDEIEPLCYLSQSQRREIILSYDTEEYPFADVVKRIIGVNCCLDDLHKSLDGMRLYVTKFLGDFLHDRTREAQAAKTAACLSKEGKTQYKSGRTVFNRRFRNRSGADSEEFDSLYRRFLKEYLVPVLGDELVYQREPTFRVHLPGDRSLGRFHTDYEYGHQVNEVNVWLPFSTTTKSNSLYVESSPCANDFHPLELKYGELVCFWGNQCRHFTKANTTDVARVSIDFRVIPVKYFDPDPEAGRNRDGKQRFLLGQYYLSTDNEVVEMD